MLSLMLQNLILDEEFRILRADLVDDSLVVLQEEEMVIL